MKRVLLMLAIVVAGAWAAFQAVAPAAKPLSSVMPPDALLYLEAKDFGSLLAEWNASPQKAAWLKSDNYSAFARSRLFQRLARAQEEFAGAAGLPPDMTFATAIAGGQSALAIYDIGKLEFVYVTRMPSAKSTQTALWQLRTTFEPRSANGASFFVRTDPQSKRVVGFGAMSDYLVLGTREDLVASAMGLLAGQPGRTLGESDWFRKSLAAAPKQGGDLRMVLDLAEITKTAQFRTYWVQQNISETRQYSAGVVDLYRSASEYREERVLVRRGEEESGEQQGTVATEGTRAMADLLKFVPQGAGVYRAVANPVPKAALRLMVEKILLPHIGPAPVQPIAPKVVLTSGQTGSESDLETHIDQPPAPGSVAERPTEELEAQLARAQLRASLQIEATHRPASGVFVGMRTVLVFAAGADWNADAIRTAIQRALQPGLTASQLGVEWVQAGDAYRLSGLMPIAIASRGRYLFLSNDPAMLESIVGRISATATSQPALYAAGFNHAGEHDNFLQLTRLVHRAVPPAQSSPAMANADSGESRTATSEGSEQASEREPDFFSENIASLSATLQELKSESIVVRQIDHGVRQSVVYTWMK